MYKPIISVKNLSKKYVIGEKQQYYSLRDSISNVFKNPFKKEGNKRDEFWALKDVSFDVNEGDVVGIIGRNGAGKSTLLKILSQITPPTTGEIRLGGRAASLLEVGTGFHQELTGRENIYLNGAILGMKRREINKKFDEIVDFAEIEKFLDTPVKHYSSGMYMRLAFAVAAHLEPEILIVDEVLAVGDTQFQKKCLGKMSEVSKQGRTVLFVSHNMGAISQMCDKCILLDHGEMIAASTTDSVIKKYLSSGNKYLKNMKINSNSAINFNKIKTTNGQGINSDVYFTDDVVKIYIDIRSKISLQNSVFSIVVKNSYQTKVFTEEFDLSSIVGSNKLRLCLKIPDHFLVPDDYTVDFYVHIPNELIIASLTDISLFKIVDNGTKFSKYGNQNYGVVLTSFKWDIAKV